MTFLRYIAIQVSAYGIDVGAFLILLTTEQVTPVFANVMAKIAAGIFAFLAHRHFTFSAARGTAAGGQAVKYFALLLINIPVASAILALLLIFVYEPVLVKLVADVICVGMTYLLSKKFIFNSRPIGTGRSGSEGAGT